MQKVRQLLGIESHPVSHIERLASGAGAFVGIFAVYLISAHFLDRISAMVMVASMGASAVLLFAVPHGPLSQPWQLIGGHLFSAIIGVTCAKLIANPYIAAPVAVGLAVTAMHYLRCIHPPGGATALVAVIGGSKVAELGYGYVLTPVMFNTLVILIAAVAFNFFFPWRRYPSYLSLARKRASGQERESGKSIAHEDFVYALSQIDSYIDISEDDLMKIYELAMQRHDEQRVDVSHFKLGHYYSNGEYGERWSVRQIVDWEDSNDETQRMLIYKIVAGQNRRTTATTTLKNFSHWAKYEVERDEENWRRVSN